MQLRTLLGTVRRALHLPAPPAVAPWRRAVAAVPAPPALRAETTAVLDVYAVYRRRNADQLARLIDEPGVSARLWALDETAPELAGRTLGSGPGGKFTLLNELLEREPPRDGSTVVFADDDVRLPAGGLAALAGWAARSGLELFQPAHAARSHASHGITVAVPASLVRTTDFVEIGPVFAVTGRGRDAVLPFPEEASMGWGLELTWRDLCEQGLRLGVVDAVRMVHLSPVAAGYDDSQMRRATGERLAALGATRWSQVQTVGQRWWRWQDRPPWLTE